MTRIAAIIPCHRQPGLLAEALAAALGQKGAPPLAAVVVDDGCPCPETAEVALAWAAAHPGRVHYLRRPNGRLPAARNTGIAHALAAFPELRAILPLDADNRLHPHYVARMAAALEAAPPATGWAFPDVDMFGTARELSAEGAHDILQHLGENTAEAGSLIRAALFRQGLRYDESLREGFEDWEFWLQAIAAGWRGLHVPMAGFRYRNRPESLRAAAEARRPALLAMLRAKHRRLFAPHALLALEAAEAPRFALLRPDGMAAWFLDPATPASWRPGPALPPRAPQAAHHPPVTLLAAPGALPALEEARLLRGALWLAEAALRDRPAALLRLSPGPMRVAAGPAGEEDAAAASLLALRSDALAEAAAAPGRHWLDALAEGRPDGRTGLVHLRSPLLPTRAEGPEGSGLGLGPALDRLRSLPRPRPATWREEIRRPRQGAAPLLREVHGIGATLPLAPHPRSLVFVLPLLTLGGVERATAMQAAAFRRRGWRTALAVLAPRAGSLPHDLRDAFDDLILTPREGLDGTDPHRHHAGAPLPAAAEDMDLSDLLGLLVPFRAAILTHSPTGHVLAARLRRLGTRTFAGLHLVEPPPAGSAHALPGWEGAYDGITVISRHLAAWCEARGIPPSKLHHVPNAPGHAATAPPPAREGREGPLRVLFLGRLDRQKGADRLPGIMAALRDAPVTFRILGQPVLDAAPPGLRAEPPATTPAALDAAYAWADAVILPSRAEGVPLTVLEAQRMGCVVVATRTGAVEEAVADGVDGILLPPHGEVEAGFAAALRRLAADRALLRTLSAAAAARAAPLDWDRSIAAFAARLESMVESPA